MKPVFSICILTYNRKPLLDRALKSCIGLVNPHVEIVVIDNASTDNTKDLMKKWVRKYPFISYIRRKQNIGFFNNFRTSFSYCRGKYIIYCGDDDVFLDPKTLEYYLLAFNNKNVGIVRSRQVNIKNEVVVQSSKTPNNAKIILYKKGLSELNPFIFDAFSLTGLAFLNTPSLTSILSSSESMYPQVELSMKLMLTYKAAQIEKILVAIQGHDNQLNVLSYTIKGRATNILDDFSDIYDRVREYAKKYIVSKNEFLNHITLFLPIFFPYGCLKNGRIKTFILITKIVRANPKILTSPLFYISITLCLVPRNFLRKILDALNLFRLKKDRNYQEFTKYNLFLASIST